MREIKFRGKNKKGNWLVGDLMRSGTCPSDGEYEMLYWDTEDGWMSDKVCVDTIGQFTGIKDGHYHDIFEGDIVKVDGCPDLGNLIVVFDEGSFALATPEEYACVLRGESPYLNDYAKLTPLGDLDYQGLYRVIGNVSDNPELII